MRIRPMIGVLGVAMLFSVPASARDLLVPAGEKGTLAIDQISGFRASMVDGISYAGPIGFSYANASEHAFNADASTTRHTTTFWVTPSADLFVLEHLSVGLLAEVLVVSSNVDVPTNNTGTTHNVSLPGTTSITLLPRVGYLLSVTDHFAVWPRLGVGYARRETVQGADAPDTAVKDTFDGVVFDVDVGLIYRINETFFVRGSPDFVFTLGGHHAQSFNNQNQSNDASFVQASAVFGIGVFLDLY